MADQSTVLRVRAEVENLEGLNRLRTAVRGVANEAKAGNNDFARLLASIQSLDGAATKSINSLQGQRNAFDALRRSVAIGSDEFKKATAEIARLDQQLAKAEGRKTTGGFGRLAQTVGAVASGGVFGGLEGLTGGVIGGITGGPAGALAGAAIGAQVGQIRQAIGAIATYGSELNKLRIALRGVTETQQDYEESLLIIKQATQDFAIPTDTLTREFTRLQASVVGAGGTVRDTETVFRGIISAVRATGGSLQDVSSALTAASQVFSKGKVSAEELRQQIGERLPGAFTIFADAIKKTPQELDKALENGQVSLQDFLTFSIKLFEKYGDTAQTIADAPEAAGDRLTVVLRDLQEKIAPELSRLGAQFQNFASEAIKGLVALFTFLDKVGKAIEDRIGGDALKNATRTFEQTSKNIAAIEAKVARGQALSEAEKTRLIGQERLRAGALRTIQQFRQGPPSPGRPSELPSSQDGAGRGDANAAKRLAREAQQSFDSALRQLGANLDAAEKKFLASELTKIEIERQKAAANGNKLELESLDIKEGQVRLDVLQSALLTEKQKLEERLLDGQRKRLDVTKVAERLSAVSVAFSQLELDQRKLLTKQTELQVEQQKRKEESEKKATEQIQDAASKYGLITKEQKRILDISREIANLEPLKKIVQDPQILDLLDRIIAKLNELKNKTTTFGDTFAQSFGSAIAEMGKLADNLGAAFGNAFMGMADQLADFVSTGKASFSDFARSVLNDLTKIFARAAFFYGLQAILPGNVFSSLFPKFAMGGIMTPDGPMPLKRYAGGGIANSPQLAMFGEGRQPEAYVPLPDGRSIPVTMQGGGQGVNVVVNVDAAGSAVQGDGPNAKALGVAISSAVKAEILKQQRPGGYLAGTR